MRGIVGFFCAAAGAAIWLAGFANAADSAHAKSVSLSLAGHLGDRPASAYLAGIPFAASSGPLAASGVVLTRSNLVAAYGPPQLRAYDLRDFAASVSLAPALALNLGYQLDDAGRFVRTDFSGSYDGLFLKPQAFGADATPFASRASYVGVTWLLADDLKFNLGAASYAPQQSVDDFDTFANLGKPLSSALVDYGAHTGNSLMAGVSWDFAPWAGLDFTAAQSGAHDGLLNDTIDTTAINVSAHVKFGNGWVTTASYGQAMTKLDLKPSALSAPSSDALHRTGYALAVAKHGVFGDDAIGLSVSSQAATPDAFAVVENPQATTVYIGRENLLADLKPETDIEVGYVTTFLDGSLALQTNAAYQMNFAGQNGTNAVSLLSRAKIKF